MLDSLRPYLISDGGNVKLVEIQGRNILLEMEGACVSCIAQEVTVNMGIEKRLKQVIPQVKDVIVIQ